MKTTKRRTVIDNIILCDLCNKECAADDYRTHTFSDNIPRHVHIRCHYLLLAEKLGCEA